MQWVKLRHCYDKRVIVYVEVGCILGSDDHEGFESALFVLLVLTCLDEQDEGFCTQHK